MKLAPGLIIAPLASSLMEGLAEKASCDTVSRKMNVWKDCIVVKKIRLVIMSGLLYSASGTLVYWYESKRVMHMRQLDQGALKSSEVEVKKSTPA